MTRTDALRERWAEVAAHPLRASGVAALALLGFVIPIDTSLVGLATIIVLIVWLARGRFLLLPAQVRGNAVVQAALLLFGILALGLLYTPVDLGDALSTLKKYRELLLIPILMSLAETKRERRVAIAGFMVAIGLSIFLSYLEWFRVINIGRPFEPTAFHHRIIYGTFVAYFVFWLAHRATDSSGWWRWLWLAVAVAGTVNLFYAIGSRTAYVIFFALVALFSFQRFRLRGLIIAAIVLAIGIAALYSSSRIFAYRVNMAVISLVDHDPDRRFTPTDSRLFQWRRALLAIGDSPIIGHGVGGYGTAISRYSNRTRLRGGQPHSEYLMITIQAGIVGLAAFIWLLLVQWRTASRMPPPSRYLAEGLVASFVLTCAFNSALLNSPEGHFYGFLTALLFAGPIPTRAEIDGA